MKLTERVFQIIIGLDQVGNCCIGSGYADETLSAYAHRKRGWRRHLVNGIFFWQHDHCKSAYESEKLRKHLPKEYSNGD